MNHSVKHSLQGLGRAVGALALVVGMMAVMPQPAQALDKEAAKAKAALKRIAPVGAVATAADAPEASTGDAPAVQKTPEELYNMACAACHASGVLDAPKLGDADDWAARSAAEGGLDGLVTSAINGKGSMPPRGGTTFTDEEVKAAVQYMSGLE